MMIHSNHLIWLLFCISLRQIYLLHSWFTECTTLKTVSILIVVPQFFLITLLPSMRSLQKVTVSWFECSEPRLLIDLDRNVSSCLLRKQSFFFNNLRDSVSFRKLWVYLYQLWIWVSLFQKLINGLGDILALCRVEDWFNQQCWVGSLWDELQCHAETTQIHPFTSFPFLWDPEKQAEWFMN